MNTLLYVIRHGETTHNRDDITSGHVDPELTKLGRKQALSAKKRLSGVNFDEAYSSDLKRAYETAAIIFGRPVPTRHRLTRLRERNFGSLDGKPAEHKHAILHEHISAHGPLSHDDQWVFKHVPDMENDQEVAERFIDELSTIATSNIGKTILVAAHGGTLRTTLIGLQHGNMTDYPAGSIQNASYIKLGYDGTKLYVIDASDAVK